MTRAITTWLCNAAAIAIAAWLFGGISIGRSSDESSQRIITLLVVAAVFTVINLYVAPVVKMLSIPFIILSLGLALIVINALLLLLTDWITGKFGVAFVVDGFWVAVFGSIVISLVNGALGLFFDRK